MSPLLRRLLAALVLCAAAFAPLPAGAQDGAAAPADAAASAELRALVDGLAGLDFDRTAEQVTKIAATGDPAAATVLKALSDGDLYVRQSDGTVFIARKAGRDFALFDAITGEASGEAGRREVEKLKVNNRLRTTIRSAMASLTLLSPDPAARRTAAQNILRNADPESIDLLDAAIAEEQDAGIALIMVQARAVAIIRSDRPDAEKLAAIEALRDRGGRSMIGVLSPIAQTEGPVGQAAASAIASLQGELVIWDAAQNVWYGLSLGSVLLLAAIGLAITFGVMGVINMAHGEMVMIGAYTTFVVQEILRANAPWLLDWSLAMALPLAFLVAGLVGIAIERGIIRYLYGRPLETLLATWGLSLILQQAVRTIFGPTNRAVSNPSWMSGSFELGNLSITYNRLWIVVFAIGVFIALMILLRRTSFGLQMRAVTQNRAMASAMGIRTPLVDALTFGLGSGIAGIAGVALSQIDNVSPDLGQSYIIDSFMVVVFGGVGNLWGTLVGAMTLGVANKFLEPYAGAVLGKIAVLVFIILFIQRRPRGLFALRGRAIEA